ncbi:MIR1, partial [Symbiodinium necroappetens]
PASFECIEARGSESSEDPALLVPSEESVWLGYEPSDDTIAQAWAENVAADPAQITALWHHHVEMWTPDMRMSSAWPYTAWFCSPLSRQAPACFADLRGAALGSLGWAAFLKLTSEVTPSGRQLLSQVEEFVLEPLTLDKAVACYRITGGSTMCRALELVSESLSQGAEVLLSAAETYHISLTSLVDGAAVCFQQGLDTWRCRLLDVGSSSSLSMPEPRPAEPPSLLILGAMVEEQNVLWLMLVTRGPELVVPGTLSGLACCSGRKRERERERDDGSQDSTGRTIRSTCNLHSTPQSPFPSATEGGEGVPVGTGRTSPGLTPWKEGRKEDAIARASRGDVFDKLRAGRCWGEFAPVRHLALLIRDIPCPN